MKDRKGKSFVGKLGSDSLGHLQFLGWYRFQHSVPTSPTCLLRATPLWHPEVWGVIYWYPEPAGCVFYSIFLGKEDSAVSKLESWLWLSDLLLPARHVKKEKEGKFNANLHLFEARPSLVVSHCSSLWRKCFSPECFHHVALKTLDAWGWSPCAGPRTSQSPGSSCSGGDRLSLPWLEVSDL